VFNSTPPSAAHHERVISPQPRFAVLRPDLPGRARSFSPEIPTPAHVPPPDPPCRFRIILHGRKNRSCGSVKRRCRPLLCRRFRTPPPPPRQREKFNLNLLLKVCGLVRTPLILSTPSPCFPVRKVRTVPSDYIDPFRNAPSLQRR